MPQMTTLAEILDAVALDQRRAGEVVQAPASPEAVERTRDALRRTFGASLPTAMVEVATRMNGVDFDGVVIYGVGQTPETPGLNGFWQGLCAVNALWRADEALDYLVVGETDLDLLTVDLAGDDAGLRDKVSREVIETFESVGEMIAGVLRRRL